MTTQRFENGDHFFWFAKQNRVQCPEIGYLARKIAQCYTEETGKDAAYIEHIISNVYLGWAYNQAVAYFSKNEYWTVYNATIKNRKDKFSVIKFRDELKFLASNDLIHIIRGKKVDGKPYLSMASRMISTEKLEAEFDIAWEVYAELADENIRFKKAKDEASIPATELAQHPEIEPMTEKVERRKEDLTDYNRFIRQQFCTYDGEINTFLWNSDLKSTVVDSKIGAKRFIPLLSSVYSGGWDKGGRLYARSVYGMCAYQQLSKAERSTIRINGEKTVEVDYSCLHLSLMYAKCGKQLTKDAYAWTSDRTLAKKITIICLNNKTYAGAIKACKRWLEDYGYDTRCCKTSGYICDMLRYHSDIKEHFFKKGFDALTMQNIDSSIMMNVLKACRKRNIPALPVHDSIIVPEKYQEAAVRIMKNEYKTYTGFDISVK